MKLPQLLLIPVLLLALPVLAEKPLAPEQIAGTIRISAEQAVDLILSTPNLVVIDSRVMDEYAKGHIEGAISLLDTQMSEDILAEYVPDKATPLLFYCNGERCMRSGNACIKALAWGYSKVYWFRGGWKQWQAKELPVAR
jgi:rhodanese-related sulfurtransferase